MLDGALIRKLKQFLRGAKEWCCVKQQSDCT
jgi:hypothetical protein